jgi:hypothetical protein
MAKGSEGGEGRMEGRKEGRNERTKEGFEGRKDVKEGRM